MLILISKIRVFVNSFFYLLVAAVVKLPPEVYFILLRVKRKGGKTKNNFINLQNKVEFSLGKKIYTNLNSFLLAIMPPWICCE